MKTKLTTNDRSGTTSRVPTGTQRQCRGNGRPRAAGSTLRHNGNAATSNVTPNNCAAHQGWPPPHHPRPARPTCTRSEHFGQREATGKALSGVSLSLHSPFLPLIGEARLLFAPPPTLRAALSTCQNLAAAPVTPRLGHLLPALEPAGVFSLIVSPPPLHTSSLQGPTPRL